MFNQQNERVLCILFFWAIGFVIAGAGLWHCLNIIFDATVGKTDYQHLSPEMQALKIPLNLLMYAIPAVFYGVAVALLTPAGLYFIAYTLHETVVGGMKLFNKYRQRKEEPNA